MCLCGKAINRYINKCNSCNFQCKSKYFLNDFKRRNKIFWLKYNTLNKFQSEILKLSFYYNSHRFQEKLRQVCVPFNLLLSSSELEALGFGRVWNKWEWERCFPHQFWTLLQPRRGKKKERNNIYWIYSFLHYSSNSKLALHHKNLAITPQLHTKACSFTQITVFLIVAKCRGT